MVGRGVLCPPGTQLNTFFAPPPPRFSPPQDCFFYSLVFDPVQKTLLADQGEIRVGCKYQAEIPDRLAEGVGKGGGGAALCWEVRALWGGGLIGPPHPPPLLLQANQTTGTNRKWR